MRTVLAVINTPTFGGPHNQLLQLNEPLGRYGWRYLAVLPEGDEAGAAKRLRSGGVDVVRIPLHRLRAVRSLRPHLDLVRSWSSEVAALRDLIRTRDISVVQVCGTVNLQPALAAYREHKGVVWQLLSNFAPWPLRAAMSPIIAKIGDVVMTTGMLTARQHAGLTTMSSAIMPFLPPVDTDRFKPDAAARSEARKELGVPEDAFLVGTVGNFNRQKSHDRIVRACPQILDKIPNSFVRILGETTPAQREYYDREVIGLAKQLGVLEDGRLRFYSPGNRVRELLPAFDVFILTSRSEGIPTAMLEAMSTGIPIVSTPIGSIPEVLKSGFSGILIEEPTPDKITACLCSLASDRPRLALLGKNAIETAVEKFSVSVCAESHAEAFTKAMLAHPRP